MNVRYFYVSYGVSNLVILYYHRASLNYVCKVSPRWRLALIQIERHDSRAHSNKIEHSLYPGNPIHRYYNLPSRTDEWEIERKFVGIDYTNKLGEGAFGSVFLGELIA